MYIYMYIWLRLLKCKSNYKKCIDRKQYISYWKNKHSLL